MQADEIKSAVRKKALGYQSCETVEEYTLVDGDMALVKKKVSTKDNPPDIAAVRLLLEMEGGDEYENMTESQLKDERDRLLKILREDGIED